MNDRIPTRPAEQQEVLNHLDSDESRSGYKSKLKQVCARTLQITALLTVVSHCYGIVSAVTTRSVAEEEVVRILLTSSDDILLVPFRAILHV